MAISAATQERRHVQMSVRVPVDLATALERVAEQEDRTVSAELRRMIRRRISEARDAAPMEEVA